LKSQVNSGGRKEIYHFRDQQGLEVDFLVPSKDGKLLLIECKATRTVQPAMANSLLSLRRTMERKAGRAIIVHRSAVGAPAMRAIAPGAEAMDVQNFVWTFSGSRTHTIGRRRTDETLDRKK
jgi:hypothetical protein